MGHGNSSTKTRTFPGERQCIGHPNKGEALATFNYFISLASFKGDWSKRMSQLFVRIIVFEVFISSRNNLAMGASIMKPV